jgi:hypothetical protein
MPITNYGELKSAVAKWINRDDLENIIPDFIALAERRIFREIRTPANERTIIFIASEDTNSISIPGDYIEMKLFLFGIPLDENNNPISPVIGRSMSQRPSHEFNITGKQDYIFTRDSSKFYFNPTLKADQAVKIIYYADFSGMNEDEDTNSILRIAPDLFLYGSLLEAELYLMNDKRVSLWDQKYNQSLLEIKRYNQKIDYKGSPVVQKMIVE